VTADLACAIADGSEEMSDFRVMTDQKELFGLVASVLTTWRTLDEIAAGGSRALARIAGAVNGARRRAWAAIEARHGRPARGADRGQGAAGRDLHPAGRHGHPGLLGQGTGGIEFQGGSASPVARVLR
jgi:hypothetical protein